MFFVHNFYAHKLTAEAVEGRQKIRTEYDFPACAADLVQPVDLFVIKCIKSKWHALWDQKIMDMIHLKMWADAGCVNPEKRYFLRLAADVVRKVRQQRDANEVRTIQMALFRCGLI